MVLAVPTKVAAAASEPAFLLARQAAHGPRPRAPRRAAGTTTSRSPSFLRRRFGQEAVERLGEPLLAGIHAGDPERLSILATFPRFRELEKAHGSLVRGSWAAPRPQRAPGAMPAAAFYSLRGGLAELVEAIVARLDAASLRTGAPRCERCRAPTTGFALALEGGERIEARSVVVAAPGPRIAGALEALVPRSAAALRAFPSLPPPRCCSASDGWTCAIRSTATGSWYPRAKGSGRVP